MVIEEVWLAYPSAHDLADANVSDVGRLIGPLGLGKRADMLIQCARQIVALGGVVPRDRKTLTGLMGAGEYVADAVRLFAFGQRAVPVDAIIGRVLRRVLGFASYGPAYADRRLWQAVQPLSGHGDAVHTVAALLDVGARLCRTSRPLCRECPLCSVCVFARTAETADRTSAVFVA